MIATRSIAIFSSRGYPALTRSFAKKKEKLKQEASADTGDADIDMEKYSHRMQKCHDRLKTEMIGFQLGRASPCSNHFFKILNRFSVVGCNQVFVKWNDDQGKSSGTSNCQRCANTQRHSP